MLKKVEVVRGDLDGLVVRVGAREWPRPNKERGATRLRGVDASEAIPFLALLRVSSLSRILELSEGRIG